MASTVLILDDDPGLLQVMGDLIHIVCGRDCVTARNLGDLERNAERALSCGLAFLDVNLGSRQPTGVDACRWLRKNGFQGALYFFTGHAYDHPQVREARELGDASVLSKPITLETLTEILEKHP